MERCEIRLMGTRSGRTEEQIERRSRKRIRLGRPDLGI